MRPSGAPTTSVVLVLELARVVPARRGAEARFPAGPGAVHELDARRLAQGQRRDGGALLDDADFGLSGGARLENDLQRVHEAGAGDVAFPVLEAGRRLAPARLPVTAAAAV